MTIRIVKNDSSPSAENWPPVVVEQITDPEELHRAQAQHERFSRNLAWLDSQAPEIFERYRGRFLCVAGEEAFDAETPEEARAKARAAHPDDDGAFVQYVPKERTIRI